MFSLAVQARRHVLARRWPQLPPILAARRANAASMSQGMRVGARHTYNALCTGRFARRGREARWLDDKSVVVGQWATSEGIGSVHRY